MLHAVTRFLEGKTTSYLWQMSMGYDICIYRWIPRMDMGLNSYDMCTSYRLLKKRDYQWFSYLGMIYICAGA